VVAEAALGEKIKEFGEDMPKVEKYILLRVIDLFWMNHLDEMNYLRESVKLRAYGHRDPLVEYKREGRDYFDRLLLAIEESAVNGIFKASKMPDGKGEQQQKRYEGRQSSSPSGIKEVGRNDPCPCGSGKKYKRCHGA